MSFFTDLLNGTGEILQQNATAYIIKEYATLQALPNRIRGLQSLGTNLQTYAAKASDPTMINGLRESLASLYTLQSQYPAMIAQVNLAYQRVAPIMNTGIVQPTNLLSMSAITDVASAVAQAKSLTSGVDTVDGNMRSTLDSLVSSGAITPDQAASLYRSTTSAMGWLPWVIGGVVIFALFRRK